MHVLNTKRKIEYLHQKHHNAWSNKKPEKSFTAEEKAGFKEAFSLFDKG